MDLGLEDKVVIVTGGAAGIGRATVEVFLEEGAKVVVVDRDKSALDAFAMSRIGEENVSYLLHDLTVDAHCYNAVQDTVERLGRLDILVNNAGGNDFLPFGTTNPQRVRESLNQNLMVPYVMSHYAWSHLIESQGNVVFVGSKVSLIGESVPGGTLPYVTAKGGINALTIGLANLAAYEKLGIRVNCVLPGKVDTYTEKVYGPDLNSIAEGKIKEGKEIPLGNRLTTPREIANTIAFLASNKASGHTTGMLYSPDGGYVFLDRCAHLPKA